jgi:hypothetical protein
MKKLINDIDAFCETLVSSKLVSEADLCRFRSTFDSRSNANQAKVCDFTEFSAFLIENRAITPWQYCMLRNNQYKGFFLKEYVILDYLGESDTFGIYLARVLVTGERVRLGIRTPQSDGSWEVWQLT